MDLNVMHDYEIELLKQRLDFMQTQIEHKDVQIKSYQILAEHLAEQLRQRQKSMKAVVRSSSYHGQEYSSSFDHTPNSSLAFRRDLHSKMFTQHFAGPSASFFTSSPSSSPISSSPISSSPISSSPPTSPAPESPTLHHHKEAWTPFSNSFSLNGTSNQTSPNPSNMKRETGGPFSSRKQKITKEKKSVSFHDEEMIYIVDSN